jgi:hypothetical protein
MNPWFSSVLVSEQTSIEENTTRIKEWNWVLRKGKKFLLH